MFYTCEIRLLVLLSQQELCFLYNSFFLFSLRCVFSVECEKNRASSYFFTLLAKAKNPYYV